MNINILLPFVIISKFIRTLSIIFVISLFLNGCDNTEKNNKNNFSSQQKIQKYTKETRLKGKVSNKKGHINSGKIIATDRQGKTVATTQLQGGYKYSLKISAGTELPITLSFYPSSNSTDKDKLVSVIIYTSITQYDISDLTTVIAKKAKALGGYTATNMMLAADSTVGVPDANKTTTGFRGDPTKQYGGWH